MDETADFPLVNRNAQLVTEVIVCIHCRDGIPLRGKIGGKRLHGGSVDILRELAAKLTRVGLTLRAVGEDPATADAAGINVNRYKYVATCLGSMIAGLGGLYYIMDYASGVWSSDGFGDRGWLSVALVIFSLWRPNLAIIGSFLFGGLYIVHNYIGGLSMQAQELFKMSPYVMTLLVLIFVSIKEKKEALPPAHLGLNYFREER